MGTRSTLSGAPGLGSPDLGAARGPDAPPSWLVPRRYVSAPAAFEERAALAGRLKPLLDDVVASRDRRQSVESDPVSFVHRFSEVDDREIVGLLASSLAYGNVVVIKRSVEAVLKLLGPSPARSLRSMRAEVLDEKLSGFVHRFTRGPDVALLLFAASRLQEEHGSLGSLFSMCFTEAGGALREAVRRFVLAMRSVDMRPVREKGQLPAGMTYLLPDGTGPGACKRLHMYLRWMVRGPDGVDLGLWKDIPPSALLMPLDTHTSRICRYLGLTRRKDSSWRTVEEVTWHLRGIDPMDPVRYDFALAHLGISRDCNHRRGSTACRACALRGACAG